MKLIVAIFMFLSLTAAFSFPMTPNKMYSPGVYCTTNDPDFHEYRYPEQIAYCERNVSFEQREEVCLRDGVSDRRDYKVDHIIPLNLGGTNSSKNLWCQHLTIDTEHLEFLIYEKVKSGNMLRAVGVDLILKCKFNRQCNPKL